MREYCTARCEDPMDYKVFGDPTECDDANWSLVETLHEPWNDGFDCTVPEDQLNADSFGEFIDWSGGGVTPVPGDLACDLNDSCAGEFDAPIGSLIPFPEEVGFSTPDSRFADYSASTTSTGTTLALDMPGSGTGYDDEHAIDGDVEYSYADCGDDVCPFYLAALSGGNDTDPWDVTIQVMDGSSIVAARKHIENIQFDLVQPVMGAWHPATGTVVIPEGALRIWTTLEIVDCGTQCDDEGPEGFLGGMIINPDEVWASVDSSGLDLDADFVVQNGTAELSISTTVDGAPPVASTGLAARERCDVAGGLTLDSSVSTSTDPDNDIDFELWYVDGVGKGSSTVVPVGTHTVSVLAVDDRGAHDRSADQTLVVMSGAACP